ncbi:BTB domain-containing protein [Mycena kentingensis (nom. inval.)]|nr:BTB domain-containing protein [Mycena kentingensis (nom. inval.)]
MATTRPTKRARDEADSYPQITRSAEYWFEDGSIVLQVESTQFRVAKTLLARHSSVFRDMLSLPPADEILLEGCPVVVMVGDKCDDWNHLLSAMYPTTYFGAKNPTMEQLSSVVRLGKKYDIPSFRQSCLERLKNEYPTTRERFLGTRAAWTQILVEEGASSSPIHVTAINLSRELGLYSTLPAAFLLLANKIVNDSNEIAHGALSLLDLADQLSCFKGLKKLTQFYTETPHKWLEEDIYIPCAACIDNHDTYDCEAALRDRIISLATKPEELVASFVDDWDEEWEKELCDHCSKVAREVYENAQESYWEALPSYFGLPPWEELLRMDFE